MGELKYFTIHDHTGNIEFLSKDNFVSVRGVSLEYAPCIRSEVVVGTHIFHARERPDEIASSL